MHLREMLAQKSLRVNCSPAQENTGDEAAAIPIFQILFLLVIVTAVGTLVTLVQKRWKRSAVWFGAFIVAATVTVLVLQSWNRTMLKVDAEYRARQAAP